MLNLLIVDDEKIERDGVRFLINKYELPFAVFEASDGNRALEIIRKTHIDVLYTDIRMPFLGGLDLIKQIREANKDITVIISSAYGEFEYARKAIGLKVEHYILKPVQLDEFLEVMNNAISECSRKTAAQEMTFIAEQYRLEKILIDLISGVEDFEVIQNKMDKIGMTFQEGSRVMFIDMQNKLSGQSWRHIEECVKKGMQGCMYVNLNETQSLVIVPDISLNVLDPYVKEVVKKAKEMGGTKICAVISRQLQGIEYICSAFNEIEKHLDYILFTDNDKILYIETATNSSAAKGESLNSSITVIHQEISKGDFYAARQGTELLFDQITNQKAHSALYVKYICMEIIKRVYDANEKSAGFEEDLRRIMDSTDINSLKHILLEAYDLKDQGKSTAKEDTESHAVRAVLAIIEQEYNKDLSLDYLSEKVFLSSSYLSYLFKKQCGIGVVRYITQLRLKKSAELLKSSNKKVIAICHEVGYEDVSYFGSLFRNYYGCTPQEYRGTVVGQK